MNIAGFYISPKQLLMAYIGSLMWVGDAAFIAHLGWAATGIFGK